MFTKFAARGAACAGSFATSLAAVFRFVVYVSFALALIGPLFGARSAGQDTSSAAQQRSEPLPSPRPAAPVSKRLVSPGQDAPPLTSGEKFKLFARSSTDPVNLGLVLVQSGYRQAINQFPEYGQGWDAFGKRFGTALLDRTDSKFWSRYAYPSLLKEDPRYFRLGEGGFGRRFGYSVKQEFVCRKDSGGQSFNYSRVMGALTSGAIANLYYPGRTFIRTIPATATTPAIPVYKTERGAELTFQRSAVAMGYGILGGMFDEFWPDIKRKLSHKRKGEMPSAER